MMSRVAEKRWLILVVMLGLVAGLLGAGDQQADATHGDDPDVDFEATYSACAGAAADSAGFEDTAGSFAEDAINCLAHYGITQGRNPTTYAPNDSVLRWQMALFLARAASPAGIVLANPATDQGFTDIGGLSDSARNAINGLAAAGIMPGATDTTFLPNRAVTRASMAMLLDSFIREARPGTGAFGSNVDKYSEVVSDNNAVFNDISGVSILEFNAIGRIYELGITRGVGDHQFGPGGFVTRAQMAAFITRALAHTIARPAGVSVQASQETIKGAGASVELLISVRDAAFEPLPDATVDVFSSTDAPAAFDADGACVSEKVSGVVGASVCRLDRNDGVTDITGDITDLTLDDISAATTVWAWTGDVGDRYGSETDSSTATVGFIKAPTQVLLSDDLEPGQQRLRLGDTIKFTFQVADEDGNPSAEPGYRIPVAISETSVAGATTGSSNTRLTDDQGRVELSFTQAGTSAAGETAKVTLQIGSNAATKPGTAGSLPVEDMTTNKVETVGADAGKYVALWSEEASLPTTLTISPGNKFTLASDEGRGATNMVTATLTDQYGAGVRGARVAFRSDHQSGAGGAGDGLKVTVAQDPPDILRSTALGDIVLEASPAYVGTGSSNVEFTLSARRTSGVAVNYDLPINYVINLAYGVTATAGGLTATHQTALADPEAAVLKGVVNIPRHQVSGSVTHTSLALSVPDDAVGLGIVFGKAPGALETGPALVVSSGRVEIVEGAVDAAVRSDIVSIGGVQRVVPCDRFPSIVGSDLPGGTAPVRCLTGEPRNNNQRTTNRSGKAVFAYNRDDADGGLETIWASYARSDGRQLLTDRLYHPWVKETEGNARGRIVVADTDNDQAVILPGSGIPQLVKYDSNDQLSSLDGLDVYANFDKHLGRVEGDRLPGYMEVGIYADTASGISKISLYGQSTYQPTRDITEQMDEDASVAVSGTGVVVIGVPENNAVEVYSGPGDQTPQTLTNNLRSSREVLMWGDENIRHTVRSGSSFGTDVAISDDGSTIVVGDPLRNHPRLEISAAEHGAVYVYTRGSDGQYQLTATLANDNYYNPTNPYYNLNRYGPSLQFGAGVDISGDGNTIVVASPGGGYQPPPDFLATLDVFVGVPYQLSDCLGGAINCESGYVQVYSKPAGGWRDDLSMLSSASLLPRHYTDIDNFADIYFVGLGNHRGVSVSHDGSVVSAGAISASIDIPDGEGGTVTYEEAGGVFIWERPDDGWSVVNPNSYNALLALNKDDAEDFGWVGAGARLSADGTVVVFSGNHSQAGEQKAELYAFPQPAAGWANSTTYQTLTLPDLQSAEVFGQWVDVSWDGSEVIANRHVQSTGDYRGAVQVFTRSSDGTYEPNGGFLGDVGGGFGRYATIGGDNSVVAADQFGGKVTWISRPRH